MINILNFAFCNYTIFYGIYSKPSNIADFLCVCVAVILSYFICTQDTLIFSEGAGFIRYSCILEGYVHIYYKKMKRKYT